MRIFRDLVEEAIGEKTPKTLFIIHINMEGYKEIVRVVFRM